jgi:signal transduction histidine kinase/ligand-binding sensor domain-containing protein
MSAYVRPEEGSDRRIEPEWVGGHSLAADRRRPSARSEQCDQRRGLCQHVRVVRRLPSAAVVLAARLVIALAWLTILPAGAAGERLPIRTFTTADGLPRDQVNCVERDARGFLWFCTEEGLARFDGHEIVTFDRRHGLRHPSVRAFAQTRDGGYWLGTTDGGLYAFSPTARPEARFTPVTAAAPGRTPGSVNALLETSDGTLWIGANQGLFAIAPGARHATEAGGPRLVEVDIFMPRDAEESARVRALAEDDEHTLWIGAVSGLYRRQRDGRVTRFTTADGLPVNEVRALAFDLAGRAWIATRVGLVLVTRHPIGSESFVRQVFTTRDGLPFNNLYTLRVHHDRLWIGMTIAASEATFDGPRLTIGRTIRGIYSIAIAPDAADNLWIGTKAGAVRLARDGLTAYAVDDGLSADIVSAIFETTDGRVCAAAMAAVSFSCETGDRFVRARPAIRRGADEGWGWSQTLRQDRRGEWWIPTGEGVMHFPAGPPESLARARPIATYTTRDGLRSNNIFRLFEDSRGDIWIATFAQEGNGLARWQRASNRLHVFSDHEGIPRDLPIVRAFAEDRAGQVWIAAEHGVLLRCAEHVATTRCEIISADDRIAREDRSPDRTSAGTSGGASSSASGDRLSGVLSALSVDQRGRLWIGTIGSGLARIDDPTGARPIPRRDTTALLSSDTIWTIAEDGAGRLYLGGGRGIDRLDPETGRVDRFTAADGVPRGDFYASFADSRGRVWFGSATGLSRLDPIDSDASRPAPPIVITGVRINGAAVPLSAVGETTVTGLTLAPGDRHVEIDYAAIDPAQAADVHYQLHLDGGMPGWTEPTTQHTVSYADLPGGTYRVRVRAVTAEMPSAVSSPASMSSSLAATESGAASLQTTRTSAATVAATGSGAPALEASVSFTVLLPVWRRPWFVGLALAIVIGIAAMIVRLRIANAVALERVRTRIAADLHDDVGASLSRIALLGDVAKRQIDDRPSDVAPMLTAMADDARELVDTMSDIVWSVDPRRDDLHSVVVRLRVFASELFDGRGIAWTLDAPADDAHVGLTPDQRRHVFLITKEALANLVRHSGATEARLRVARLEDRLRIVIEDNGRGFEAAHAETRGGRGLSNMHERTAALGGRLSIEPADDGRGTRVTLDVPLRRARWAHQRTSAGHA